MDEQSILDYVGDLVKEEIGPKGSVAPKLSNLEKTINKLEKESQQNKVMVENLSRKIDEVLVNIKKMNGNISDTYNSLSSNLSLSWESLQTLLKDKP